MKNNFFAIFIFILFSSCQSNKVDEQAGSQAGIHAVVVEEVLQTTQYTYLHVKEGGSESWLALPKMQAAAGEKYYYKNGLLMTEFESKELNRTFKEVLFLDFISTSPDIADKSLTPATESQAATTPGKQTDQAQTTSVAHQIQAVEVLQTSQYTYIRAKEGSAEFWLAVSRMQVAVGKTYYFAGGLPMTDFPSKELKRTFKEILFVDNLSTSPVAPENKVVAAAATNEPVSTGSAIPLEKKEIKMKHAKGDITIAVLLENRKSYAGKSIKISGQVTKFTPGVMKKNWIHLQDGTDFSGKFDLTITTDQEVKVGDTITAEGSISLDKDFGFGYFYEVLMEEAKISK
jgi:hypothetical protein